MHLLPIASTSEWNDEAIASFLNNAKIPMRLAVNDSSGFPRLCSLWFTFDGRHLIAATHEKALITTFLKKDNRCAFEIATNEYPYKGVRGQARAELDLSLGQIILPQLLDKYLGEKLPSLQRWLLSRIKEEYAITLHIEWISAWDYSSRMQ